MQILGVAIGVIHAAARGRRGPGSRGYAPVGIVLHAHSSSAVNRKGERIKGGTSQALWSPVTERLAALKEKQGPRSQGDGHSFGEPRCAEALLTILLTD